MAYSSCHGCKDVITGRRWIVAGSKSCTTALYSGGSDQEIESGYIALKNNPQDVSPSAHHLKVSWPFQTGPLSGAEVFKHMEL